MWTEALLQIIQGFQEWYILVLYPILGHETISYCYHLALDVCILSRCCLLEYVA